MHVCTVRFGSFEIFKTRDQETGRAGPSVGRGDIFHQLLDFVTQSYYPQVCVVITGYFICTCIQYQTTVKSGGLLHTILAQNLVYLQGTRGRSKRVPPGLHSEVFIYNFIVRCVGGSKAPPVLHSSYRTDFERDCAV